MQKIQCLKDYEGNIAGSVGYVSKNVAHGLIDRGIAILYVDRVFSYENRMMQPRTEETKKRSQRMAKRAVQNNYEIK